MSRIFSDVVPGIAIEPGTVGDVAAGSARGCCW
jgi:hypothetical protein